MFEGALPSFLRVSPQMKEALRHQDTLASQLKNERDRELSESAPKKDQRKVFDTIVFGHSQKHFDRDQLLTYYLARQLGIISSEVQVSFTSDPGDEALEDPQTLVIEPYISPDDSRNSVKKGNYATSSQDEPAAAVFAHHFSRELKNIENGAALLELVSWLKSVDTGKELIRPLEKLDAQKLRLLTPILEGIKLRYTDTQELLPHCVLLMDAVMNPAQTPESLQTLFRAELDAIEQKKKDDFAKLEARASEPQMLRSTTTRLGEKIAYFDVRGLDVNSGGFSVAAQLTGADIIVLFDTIADPDDASATKGTQCIIKASGESHNIEETLKDRLQMSEKLFGKGFKITRTYGGHPGIISSPVDVGSDLAPDNIWVALQKHLNAPRYSKAQFEKKAHEIADRIGTEQGLPFVILPPSDQYSFPQWQMILTVPGKSGELYAVTLSEGDLPFYESQLSDDKEANQTLIRAKTAISEPAEVAQERFARARADIKKFTDERSATQLLLSLDDLNLSHIHALEEKERLAILHTIAQDTLAIDQVWNKDNLTFRITQQLPDWIQKDLDTYKAERFNYVSVPKKIKVLIESLPERLSAQVLDDLVTILTSDIYKSSHAEKSYDSLLEQTISVIAQESVPRELAERSLQKITTAYTAGDHVLWESVSPQLIAKVQERYPAYLQTFHVEKDDAEMSQDLFIAKEPTASTIDRSQPVQSIFVEIGRPIRDAVISGGIERFAGEILATDRTLRLDDEHREHLKVAKAIVSQVLKIADLAPESKIRIVAGSFPGVLYQALIPRLPAHLWQKIVFYNYDAQSQTYRDSPSLAD